MLSKIRHLPSLCHCGNKGCVKDHYDDVTLFPILLLKQKLSFTVTVGRELATPIIAKKCVAAGNSFVKIFTSLQWIFNKVRYLYSKFGTINHV